MLSRCIGKRAFSSKIVVTTPVVDLDGDEMTRIIWKWIKERVSKYIPITNLKIAHRTLCRYLELPVL